MDHENDASTIRQEIHQRRPFHSLGAEVAVAILRTSAVLERYFGRIVAPEGITIQQYNVLRILRGAGEEGIPTLSIRDRMVHHAPGITRLVDKLVAAGHVRRERSAPDRRQVMCYLTPEGAELLARVEIPMKAADDAVVAALSEVDQEHLARLLASVRASLPQVDVG